MNLTEFWQIIDALPSKLSVEKRMEKLGGIVSKLSVSEYRDFLTCFDELKQSIAEREDLVNAAYLANEQCLSLDVFDYFCYWLIGNGGDVFRQAMNNPDSIVDLMCLHGGPQFEEFGTAISMGPEIDFSNAPPNPCSIRKSLWPRERQKERLPRLFSYSQV